MAEEDDVFLEEERVRNLNPNKPDWSMVVIRDSADSIADDLAVFPPVNHENLHVSSFTDGYDRNGESPFESSSPSSSSRRSASSSSFSLSPSDTDGQTPWQLPEHDRKSPRSASDSYRKSPWQSSDAVGKSLRPSSDSDEGVPPSETDGKVPRKPLHRPTRVADGVRGWWELLLVLVDTKFRNMVNWFSSCSFSSVTAIFWSFCPAMAVAVWWWMRLRARRQRCKGDGVDQLRMVIKEKEERIVQLLHQIAQMNELLVKHHKDIVSRIPI